jgi:dTDP-4-amino-4,6-dideoxygalactose transaminase
VSEWRVPFFEPDLGDAELEAVTRVLQSKWLTMGDVTTEFESRFSELIGCRYAVAVSSCTAALHLALIGIGVKPGEEVICPSLTFVATANAIRYCGAKPVFADVESLDDWNVSRRTLEAVVTPNTKAAIVVHYAGYPCEMPAVMQFAESKGLAIVEDAAHAAGASLNGRALGAWGHFGCFSFFSNKNMTTGEGGMLTTENYDVAERARRLRSHGMTSLTLDRYKGHAFSYDVIDLGYNYRMGELNASLGLVQLAMLNARNEQRRKLVEHYRRLLLSVPGLRVPFLNAVGRSGYHIMPVLLPQRVNRRRVMERMKTAGVQTSIHFRPVDTFTSYHETELGACNHLPYTHEIGERALTLPLYPSMRADQAEYVCEVLQRALAAASST